MNNLNTISTKLSQGFSTLSGSSPGEMFFKSINSKLGRIHSNFDFLKFEFQIRKSNSTYYIKFDWIWPQIKKNSTKFDHFKANLWSNTSEL